MAFSEPIRDRVLGGTVTIHKTRSTGDKFTSEIPFSWRAETRDFAEKPEE